MWLEAAIASANINQGGAYGINRNNNWRVFWGVEWSGVCRAVIFDFSDCTRLIYDSSYSRDFNVGHVVPRVTRVEPQQPTSKIKLEAQIKGSAQIGNL